ncbi:MAG TPA: VRR-NUC domain-containing protein [Rhizobacter sp.]
MPGPAAPIVAAIWAWRTWRAYEAAMTAAELAELAADMTRRKEQVLQAMRETIEKMRDEIDVRSSTFAAADTGGNSTISRRTGESGSFRAYIERRLPFRPAISAVCRLALAIPIQVPRRIRNRVPGDMVETTIEVTLKQTTASLMFEGVDEALAWTSPLKAEPCYNAGTRRAYLGTPSTRPHRIGRVFPFWPRPRGSLAPDLVISEYRRQPFEVENVFAAVEIKFPGDWLQPKQLNDYTRLMGASEKVAALRVPEDCTDATPGGDRDRRSTPTGTRRR